MSSFAIMDEDINIRVNNNSLNTPIIQSHDQLR